MRDAQHLAGHQDREREVEERREALDEARIAVAVPLAPDEQQAESPQHVIPSGHPLREEVVHQPQADHVGDREQREIHPAEDGVVVAIPLRHQDLEDAEPGEQRRVPVAVLAPIAQEKEQVQHRERTQHTGEQQRHGERSPAVNRGQSGGHRLVSQIALKLFQPSLATKHLGIFQQRSSGHRRLTGQEIQLRSCGLAHAWHRIEGKHARQRGGHVGDLTDGGQVDRRHLADPWLRIVQLVHQRGGEHVGRLLAGCGGGNPNGQFTMLIRLETEVLEDHASAGIQNLQHQRLIGLTNGQEESAISGDLAPSLFRVDRMLTVRIGIVIARL